jgi:hypothetical protein
MTYTEMDFNKFLNSRYMDMSKSNEEIVDILKNLEDYKLGKKPARIRIEGGARDGSILRINPEIFERIARPIRIATGKIDEDGHPEVEIKNIEADQPTVFYFKRSNNQQNGIEDASEVVGYLSPYGYSSKAVFLLDDGTDFTSRVKGYNRLVVLLDCDLPTVANFKKKSKAEREAEQVDPPKFIDQLGQTIEVGDTVVFTHKEYSKDALIGAGIAFGKLLKYYPKGGVLIRKIDGEEVRIISLFNSMLVKMDKNIMDRIMVGKMSV